ncbi:MAG: thioesterase [Anaerovoracaceae bacterium]
MKIPFTKEYTVSYFEVDYSLKIKPHRLVGIFQDIAVQHSDKAGYNLDWFSKNDMGWIITGWHVVIKKQPKEGDKISISTWTRRHKRVQADRTFEAKDQEGNVICYGESRWFLMNTEKRKPGRIPADFMEAYGLPTDDTDPKYLRGIIPDEDYKMPDVASLKKISTREFVVTRRDTDTNNHTNNISYIEWAMDDVADELYFDYQIIDLRVNYILECKKGDIVKSTHYGKRLDNGNIEVCSCFEGANGEGEYCQVVTIWKNKFE